MILPDTKPTTHWCPSTAAGAGAVARVMARWLPPPTAACCALTRAYQWERRQHILNRPADRRMDSDLTGAAIQQTVDRRRSRWESHPGVPELTTEALAGAAATQAAMQEVIVSTLDTVLAERGQRHTADLHARSEEV